VSFKRATESTGIEEESQILDRSEFQTVGAAKVSRTRGTDNMLALAERIERVGVW